MEKQTNDQVRFYADAPNGAKNKLCCYQVYDLNHSLDLLNRFVNKGWKFRAAFHQFGNGKNVNLKTILQTIDGDLANTFSNDKKLEERVEKHYQALKK